MIENPGRPGTPVTGERTNLEVARSASLGLWSCSKSRSNKIVSVFIQVVVCNIHTSLLSSASLFFWEKWCEECLNR